MAKLTFPLLKTLAVFAALFCVPAAARAQGVMTNGALHTGAISAPAELDEWTFTANQGDAITIAIGETGADTAFYPWIRLQGPNGAQIGNSYGALAAQISLYAPQTGTYTLIVASNDSGFNDTGSYRLTLSHNPTIFAVSPGDQGGAMTNGANHAGSIIPGDLDLWSFDAVQGAAITLRIGEVGNDSPFYPRIRLRGPNGTELDNSYGALAAENSVTAPSTGTYTVVVDSYDSGYAATGDYLLTLALTPGAFVVPASDQGGAMTNGANHSGGIHRGDIDMWSFSAVQGAAITLRIGEVGDDSPFYPQIRLRGPNGAVLDSTYGALAAEVSIYAPSTGTYTVIVTSYDSGYDATGDYLLTLALTPADFVISPGDQGGPIATNLNHPGTIHRGDIDMWSFTAVQGAAITLRIGEVGDDTPFYPQLRLRGPNGAQLDSSYGALAAEVSVYAPSTGVYTVIVSSYDSGYAATGSYLLTLAQTPSALPVQISAGDQGGAMTNGENHAGFIHRGDLDQWTFNAVQGSAITLRVGEVGDDSPFYPQIRLRGPNGTQLDSSYGALAAEVSVYAPSTGLYTVVISSYDSGYAATGNYLLTLALTPGDYIVPSGDQGGLIAQDGADRDGFIHRGDLDQWSFNSVQGRRIIVSIGELGTDSPFYPQIRLRRSNGTTIASTYGASAAQFEVNAPETGLYTVVVSSYDSGYSATGTYRLHVDGVTPPPLPSANLQITKSGILNNDVVTYTLTAINHGPQAAADVVVSDNVPAALANITCSAPGGVCGGAGNARTVSYASIPAGESRTITIVATKTTPPRSGEVVNTAAIGAGGSTDPDLSNNSVSHTLAEDDPDHDGLPTDWEIATGLNPNSSTGDDGASGDPDHDGDLNPQELANGTHPRGFATRYLAEGASNAFFDVRLALLNVGSTPAHLLLRFLQANGAPVSEFRLLPPGQRLTLTSANLGNLTSPDFSTVVESDQAIVLDRTMTWGGGYGSHAEGGVPNPANTWYLAEGSTSGDFSLFYLLQNPSAVETLATVKYLLPFGATPIVRQYSLPPNSRTTIPVDDQGPELAGTDVSAVITAPEKIIVERAMYKSTPTQVFAAGHGSAGVTTPSTNWFLAEGATGPFFDCFILLANPQDTAAQVTIDYLLSDGTTQSKIYEVPANGRATVWVDNEQLPEDSGVRPFDNVAVSSTVTSNVPIIVERTMWWPSPALGANFWTEAHNSPGATQTGTKWALAEGEVGGSAGAETYILIANTSSFAGTAVVTLYFEDGTSVQRPFELLPRSRMTVNASLDFEASRGRRFGAVIESVGSPAAQIVVERAMYTSPGGATWAAGTNALAARIQ